MKCNLVPVFVIRSIQIFLIVIGRVTLRLFRQNYHMGMLKPCAAIKDCMVTLIIILLWIDYFSNLKTDLILLLELKLPYKFPYTVASQRAFVIDESDPNVFYRDLQGSCCG